MSSGLAACGAHHAGERGPAGLHGVPWSRWSPAALDVARADSAPRPAPSAAELAAIQEAAREAGYAAGWQAGYAEGQSTGQAAGQTAGHEAGFAEGQAAGHAAGYAAGQAAGAQDIREQTERWQSLNAALADALAGLEAEMGHSLLALACCIAQRIVGDTLVQHPEAVLHAVREVLRLDCDSAPLCLWLHPDDVALVKTYLSAAADERTHRWRVLPDDTMARGGCRAETRFGTIDATLQTRWQQVSTALLGA